MTSLREPRMIGVGWGGVGWVGSNNIPKDLNDQQLTQEPHRGGGWVGGNNIPKDLNDQQLTQEPHRGGGWVGGNNIPKDLNTQQLTQEPRTFDTTPHTKHQHVTKLHVARGGVGWGGWAAITLQRIWTPNILHKNLTPSTRHHTTNINTSQSYMWHGLEPRNKLQMNMWQTHTLVGFAFGGLGWGWLGWV